MALGMAVKAALFRMARTCIEQQEYKLVWSNSINFSIFIYVSTAIAYQRRRNAIAVETGVHVYFYFSRPLSLITRR